MTPEQFEAEAKELFERFQGDACETGHIAIDQLLYKCLSSLGYDKGCEILFSMGNIWYA